MRHCIAGVPDDRPVIEFLAIAGRSSSGKSSVAAKLYKSLQQSAKYPIQLVWLGLDGFYRSMNAEQLKTVDTYNFDHADALDLEMCHRELKKFVAGEMMMVPTYDYVTHQRTDMFMHVKIALGVKKVIVIFEGLHVLNKMFQSFWTHSIWIHVDATEALKRRIARNLNIGRGEDEIRHRWNTTVEPTFKAYETEYRAVATETYWNGDAEPETPDDYDLIIKHPDHHNFGTLVDRLLK